MIGLRKFQERRSAQPQPEDLATIEAFAASRSARIVSVARHDDPWYYWLRGKLLISNMARFYIVMIESSSGEEFEGHVAFDPLAPCQGDAGATREAGSASCLRSNNRVWTPPSSPD
jgi:hypothetical protein